MSIPDIQSQGGVFLLTWAEELLTCRVDRLYEDSHYSVTAELTLRSTEPGHSGHIHQARANLTSTSARVTLANRLAKNSLLPWDSIIEQVWVLVLAAHREGEPLVQLSDMEMPTSAPYTLWPWLQARQATVAFGAGDSGKSYLALYFATLVATGISQHDLRPEQGNVLYLDYETDRDTTWERLNRITAGLDLPIPETLFYRYQYQSLANDIEQIQRHVLENKISLVVIDSAGPATGEPESAQMTTEYFRALRSLQTTTLTVAHIAKNGKDSDPFGSVFWRNLPRSNLRIMADHEPGVPEFTIGLQHTKSNNQARVQAQGYTLKFSEDDVIFKPCDLATIPDLSKTVSLTQRIRSPLSYGALPFAELVETLEEPAPSVRTALNRQHRKPGGFIQPTKGTWGNSIEV